VFPSKEHQFRGGERFGKPRPPIGRRRAKALNKQAAIYAAAFPEPEPSYTGTNVQWLLDVRAGKIKPDTAQLAAAVVLQRYGDDADPKAADKYDLSALTDDEKAVLVLLLSKVMGMGGPVLKGIALPAPQKPDNPTPDTLTTLPDNATAEQIDARIAELEAELARHEKG
jgi:hypothetical protein